MDDGAKINQRLRNAIITPVVLLLVAAGILTYQIAQLVDAAKWVDHTDRVTSAANEAQRLVSDQEAMLRGYLLTHDDDFVRSFQRTPARTQIVEMRTLTLDNAPQTKRCDEILRLYDIWLPADPTKVDASTQAIHSREARMDDLRTLFRQFASEETRLRRERSTVLDTANQTSVVVAIGLLVVLAASLALVSRKQLRDISTTYVSALGAEQEHRAVIQAQATMRASLVRVVEAMQGDLSVEEISERAIRELATATGAEVGAFYTMHGDKLELRAGYALAKNAPKTIALGEGVVGRCAREKKIVHMTDVPLAYLDVASATGEHGPVEIVLVPAVADREVFAVAELGFLRRVDASASTLFERVGEAMGVAVRSALMSARLHELLEESRRQAEELQTQQEELRAINEELQTQSEEVARASRYKSEFLANISHELRTPLNSSLILANLLAENKTENLTTEQVEYARTIHSAGKDLLALIDDILDLAKIESGTVAYEVSRTTLREIVDPVASLFAPLAKQKKLELRVVVGDATVQTDVRRVQQILKNLLANALKFTTAGAVDVDARSTQDAIVVRVTDTGIGIGAEEHEKIFEAFHQVQGSTSRRFAGSGLGLSISRDLARGLGGEIQVESVEGKGSTFTLRIPTRSDGIKTRAPHDVAKRAHEHDSILEGKTVLVAEDDVRGVFALSKLLEPHGAKVVIARNGHEALELVDRGHIDVVVMDLVMPDLDGFAAIEQIRAKHEHEKLPIIAITGKAILDGQARSLRAGANDYVVKPFDDEQFLSLVRMWAKK